MAKSAKQLSGGCLTLFGLPFLAAGLFLSWLYFSGYTKWWSAQRWVETPCWIESAELKVTHDDSTTYKATATYRYEYEGRAYHGDQVALGGGSDNIGSFQQDAHREISAHLGRKPGGAEREPRQGSSTPFRCFVNPSKPSEAVLYRVLRWQMQAFMAIFALTFPAVGAGLVFGGILGMRELGRENALREAHPGEPWRWKTAWVRTAIPESTSLWVTALFLYTCWAGFIIVPLIVATAWCGAFQQSGTSWLVFIFVALWSIPLWFSLKRFRHRLAVGRVCFEPKEIPAWPGGKLQGDIILEKPLPMRGEVEVSLSCQKATTRRSGDGDTTSTETLWSHRENVPQDLVTRDMSGFRLPVGIPLPADAPDSGETSDPSIKHVWKLELKVPGTAIHSVFEVPVFRTEKSPAVETAVSPGVASILDDAAMDLPALLAGRRIRAEFDPSGLPVSIICPPARHLSLIVFLVIFDLLWSAAAVFLIAQKAPLMFRIVWPVSAALIWLIVIWQILHKRSVIFGPDGLELRNQFGPVIRTQSFEKSQITGFSHDTNMTSNNTSFYRVRLESVLGKKHTLADGITGSTTAEALVKRLEAWKRSGG